MSALFYTAIHPFSKGLEITFGTTAGREALMEVALPLLEIFSLFAPIRRDEKSLFSSFTWVKDLTEIVFLAGGFPYLFQTVGEEGKKWKMASDGDRFCSEERIGQTKFFFECQFKPLKALSRVFLLLSVALDLTIEHAKENRILSSLSGTISHLAKAIFDLCYLYELSSDKSRSFTKGCLMVSEDLSKVLLFSLKFFGIRSIRVLAPVAALAGLLTLVSTIFIQMRKLEKHEMKVNLCRQFNL